ncbi:hypothetical protein [Endozoicomonas numazuensis]|uniref:hypothetical protein n=1 Tax=Endozoicomonas numazuensis TaxID=1137799 RepID=UPI000A979CC9|nr:hypothetical protein [Endozoicomonas numazuensis]
MNSVYPEPAEGWWSNKEVIYGLFLSRKPFPSIVGVTASTITVVAIIGIVVCIYKKLP